MSGPDNHEIILQLQNILDMLDLGSIDEAEAEIRKLMEDIEPNDQAGAAG